MTQRLKEVDVVVIGVGMVGSIVAKSKYLKNPGPLVSA